MIILIGFAAALVFTLTLWRFGGSLTNAAGYFILFGALALLGIWALGQPWVIELLNNIRFVRDEIGGADYRLVIWSVVMGGVFGIVVFTKPKES